MAQHSDVQLKPPAVLQTDALALARREGLGLATFVRQLLAIHTVRPPVMGKETHSLRNLLMTHLDHSPMQSHL